MTGGLMRALGGGGGGSTSTDSGGTRDPEPDTSTDFETGDSGSPDLDMGQADPGGGLEFDSDDSEGNVVDSDGDPGGPVTIISDGNTDDSATDDAQQDLTDDALNRTGGDSDGSGGSSGSTDGGDIPSGVVDAEEGEYTGGGTEQPDNSPANTGDSGESGPLAAMPMNAVLVAAVVVFLVYGGD
ncbi:hypothetical protein [Halobaculum sp. EA56]|uniref:hypothetical protein n=1 Tax=Halobaculum sp. EA56 TaxID=3421648 RepID=UPI003EBD8C90